QAYSVDVDGVDRRQGPSEFEAKTSAGLRGDLSGGLLIVDDGSLDVFHDDDRDIGDCRVLTDTDGGGNRHSGRLQGSDDPVLPGDVMSRSKEMSQRGSTGDPRPARLVVDAVGEVRLPLPHPGPATRTGNRLASGPYPSRQTRQVEIASHLASHAFCI